MQHALPIVIYQLCDFILIWRMKGQVDLFQYCRFQQSKRKYFSFNNDVINLMESYDNSTRSLPQTVRSKIRGYIRQLLMPIQHSDSIVVIQGCKKIIHPNVLKFIRKIKKLFPLKPKEIRKEDAERDLRQKWQARVLEDSVVQCFDKYKNLSICKFGSAEYSEYSMKLSIHHSINMTFPKNSHRAFLLALNCRMSEHLDLIIDAVLTQFRQNSGLLVGNKKGKKKLGKMAESVLSRAAYDPQDNVGFSSDQGLFSQEE